MLSANQSFSADFIPASNWTKIQQIEEVLKEKSSQFRKINARISGLYEKAAHRKIKPSQQLTEQILELKNERDNVKLEIISLTEQLEQIKSKNVVGGLHK